MAILRLLVASVLASGCYAPDLADCAVTCTADSECAGDQVCTGRGLCAGAVTACEGGNTSDAGASRTIVLRVAVMGEGKIAIAGGAECVPPGSGPMGEMCTLTVPAGPLVIEAIPVDDDPFERWTSLVCAGQTARCEVALHTDASVSAKFK